VIVAFVQLLLFCAVNDNKLLDVVIIGKNGGDLIFEHSA
jgi:hypothetical protein